MKEKILQKLSFLMPSRHSSFPGLLFGAFVFILASFILGFGSSWYMLEKGSPLTRSQYGPWQNWNSQGNVDSDPYTQAYIARSGRLPLNGGYAQYFKAKTDSKGDELKTNCSYMLQGAPIAADWWSIGLYDRDGQIMPNKAERYAFNSKNIARLETGGYLIEISPYARPNNWLPLNTKSDHFVLLIRAYGVQVSQETKSSHVISASLPIIQKTECS